ncbi:hypothetical protein Ccrd_006215 [Cynara cardunculus var. scolymus]|uniref:Uncharacterized protein n=1 Tax=Cynara cardunculus var. scolymus TaxID=59895 RepID=A0A103XJA4_CYNCS|nr:hypothetical protein Ccrd_006215 [Cynara cardunculus var. scolymus]
MAVSSLSSSICFCLYYLLVYRIRFMLSAFHVE